MASLLRPDDASPTGRVLIVEDEPLVRRMLVRLLGNWGYEPVEAADGPSAVDRYQQEKGRLDLILLDIMLPIYGGVEVARRIRAEDPTLPIVVCSAVIDQDVRAELLNLDVQRCLEKPVSADRLRVALSETLQH